MLALPSQKPGLSEVAGISREELDREAWSVDRAGEVLGGAAAVNRVLLELPGWGLPARLYAIPPVRWIEDRVYRCVAAHRGALARFIGAKPEVGE